MSRPNDNSLLIMDVFPPSAAKWSRLDPLLLFKAGLAPFCINIWKATWWLLEAVHISGVTPSLSLESTWNPWDSNDWMISMSPLFAAAWSNRPSLSLYSALKAQSSTSAGSVLSRTDEIFCSRRAIETNTYIRMLLKWQLSLRLRNRKRTNLNLHILMLNRQSKKMG